MRCRRCRLVVHFVFGVFLGVVEQATWLEVGMRISDGVYGWQVGGMGLWLSSLAFSSVRDDTAFSLFVNI